MERLLVYLALIYQGNYQKIKRAIENGENYPSSLISESLRKLPCSYTTILSDDYPKSFWVLKEPPWVIFYIGDITLTQLPMFSMVGMREPSTYGKQMAQTFALELSSRFVIVSGLAKGIDSISHRYARKTIAVLGCGIDICYPKENQHLYQHIMRTGLVISEYPPGVSPQRYYFPWRNRLVAALGEGVLVVEAKPKSGSMITVGHALEQGKSVFVVPCRIGDFDGNLSLIRDGACLVRNVSDIYEELNLSYFDTKGLTRIKKAVNNRSIVEEE